MKKYKLKYNPEPGFMWDTTTKEQMRLFINNGLLSCLDLLKDSIVIFNHHGVEQQVPALMFICKDKEV